MSEAQRIKLIDAGQITELASQAQTVARRRTHLLLHRDHQDQVQRLIIVLQPGTYIRPHHHSHQWELVVLLQGRGDLLRFEAGGCLAHRLQLSSHARVAQIPAGVWHGFVVLENETAVMEIKPGPYRQNEFAHWAPEEGAPDANGLVEWFSAAELGTRWSGIRD